MPKSPRLVNHNLKSDKYLCIARTKSAFCGCRNPKVVGQPAKVGRLRPRFRHNSRDFWRTRAANMQFSLGNTRFLVPKIAGESPPHFWRSRLANLAKSWPPWKSGEGECEWSPHGC